MTQQTISLVLALGFIAVLLMRFWRTVLFAAVWFALLALGLGVYTLVTSVQRI